MSTSAEPQPSNDILYSDPHFHITATHLTIKYYYFPVPMPIVIPLTEIVSIDTFEDLNLGWFSLKTRYFLPANQLCIVEVKDDCIRKGFSVDDHMAIEILRKAWREALAAKNS
ncbi:8174_t:CDS:2 [Acaulospora morrowiae]|uniref:8174_t:CDS:1 n=1 Tax=Acaulospora morrowiae TaxID=94023 RepID=A0A9N9BQX7_9GLOM|nr:8174_t:CDS:2 [Acaulospora morrowiae]